jgi:hypothetical protein
MFCFQAVLQQLEMNVELSGPIYLICLRKAAQNTSIYTGASDCTENRAIGVLRDMNELKDVTGYERMIISAG